MIAALGFLELMQVIFEFLLAKECGAVDAHQLLAVGITAPIGAADLGQARMLQPTRVGHVRPAAQVHEVPMPVEAQGFTAGPNLAH